MGQRTADERTQLPAVACHDRGATVQPLRPVAFDPEGEHAMIFSEPGIMRLCRGFGTGPGLGAATDDHRCVKTEDQKVAAGHSVDPARWQDRFEVLMDRIAGRFARWNRGVGRGRWCSVCCQTCHAKNCWTLAEFAGDTTPDGMQHLLSRARWDADAVRDDIRGFVVEQLRHHDAVLVVDETGDLKKGTATVGVQRQYTGTAGRIENSQVAVYLAYSTPRGHAAIDRELYVPRSWAQDTARCQAAGIPDTVSFATKPALAARMIGRALDAGVPASWVAGDEVYGGNPHLRTVLEGRQVGYVLAVACDHQIMTRAGKFRADVLVKKLPKRAWQKLSVGAGAKRYRFYDWALADIADDRPGHRHLLVRRNRRTGELAFYRCYSAARVPLSTLVKSGRSQMDSRGDLPIQQGSGRARRTPGQALDVLASLGHPRDARPRLPRRSHRR
jgi:hypothetical protein